MIANIVAIAFCALGAGLVVTWIYFGIIDHVKNSRWKKEWEVKQALDATISRITDETDREWLQKQLKLIQQDF